MELAALSAADLSIRRDATAYSQTEIYTLIVPFLVASVRAGKWLRETQVLAYFLKGF